MEASGLVSIHSHYPTHEDTGCAHITFRFYTELKRSFNDLDEALSLTNQFFALSFLGSIRPQRIRRPKKRD